MNPFLSLRSLAASIEHSEEKVFVVKVNLNNAGGLHPRSQDILDTTASIRGAVKKITFLATCTLRM